MATTVNDVLTEVDELKPNTYDDALKIKWLEQIDQRIYNEIVLTHQDSDDITIPSDYDVNTELIVGSPYDVLYKFWLFVQIDFYNNETDRYSNSMIMFNNSFQEFASHYNHEHRPLIAWLDL